MEKNVLQPVEVVNQVTKAIDDASSELRGLSLEVDPSRLIPLFRMSNINLLVWLDLQQSRNHISRA